MKLITYNCVPLYLIISSYIAIYHISILLFEKGIFWIFPILWLVICIPDPILFHIHTYICIYVYVYSFLHIMYDSP